MWLLLRKGSEVGMVAVTSYNSINYANIPLDINWNDSNENELIMHTIHAYPAKFPAFVATKAFEYAQDEGVEISTVADIFCGCGTVALESKLHNFDFWGCDINPVATLIAKVKSNNYNAELLKKYFGKICKFYSECILEEKAYDEANNRLQYWFTKNNYCELLRIYLSINCTIDDEKYSEAFKCIFSAILKACSKWLTKSIKPQVDPKKKDIDVFQRFVSQYKKFLRAVEEMDTYDASTVIQCGNFLSLEKLPNADLIVTSPPYVTSYEYADLHQLSSLWLQYTDDYRELRKGSIGSVYNSNDFLIDFDSLNITGKHIVKALIKNDKSTAKVKSVARYFSDMQKVVEKCTTILNPGGMVLFVVGDTEYKGVKIQNSKHLIESLEKNGYTDIKISKRTISKGICVPYRDEKGKFSTDKSNRTVYHEEFIISGRM